MNTTGVPLVEFVEDVMKKHAAGGPTAEAIVLGCGGGLTTLLLTRTFAQVLCAYTHCSSAGRECCSLNLTVSRSTLLLMV